MMENISVKGMLNTWDADHGASGAGGADMHTPNAQRRPPQAG